MEKVKKESMTSRSSALLFYSSSKKRRRSNRDSNLLLLPSHCGPFSKSIWQSYVTYELDEISIENFIYIFSTLERTFTNQNTM